jgi:hypothetical protein
MSWETLKYNIRMGAGLSLSGVFNTGHDVDGFSGPAPSPEFFEDDGFERGLPRKPLWSLGRCHGVRPSHDRDCH